MSIAVNILLPSPSTTVRNAANLQFSEGTSVATIISHVVDLYELGSASGVAGRSVDYQGFRVDNLDKITGVWLAPTETTGSALKDDDWILLVPRIVSFTFTNHMQSERIAIDVLEPLAPRLAVIARKFMLPSVELFVDGSALDVNKPLFGQPLVKAPSTHCSPHATIIAMAGKSTVEARDDRSDTDRVATLRSVVRQRSETSPATARQATPPPPTLPPGTRLARATHDYTAEDDTELSLAAGDLLVVTLVGEEMGWWQGYKVAALTSEGGDTAAYNFPGGFVCLVEGADRVADLLRTFTSQRRRVVRPDANSRRRMTAVRNRVSMALTAGDVDALGDASQPPPQPTVPLTLVSQRLKVEKRSLAVLDELLDNLYAAMDEERTRQRLAARDAAVLRHKLDALLATASPNPSTVETTAVLLRKRLERSTTTHNDLQDSLAELQEAALRLTSAKKKEGGQSHAVVAEAVAAAQELSGVLAALADHRLIVCRDLRQVATLILGMEWPAVRQY